MKPVFNERKLRAWLEPLSHRQRVAFALSCCERLPLSQRRLLDRAWAFVVTGVQPADDIEPPAPTEPTAVILSLLRKILASGSLDHAIEAAAATAEAAESLAAQDLGLADDAPEADPRIAGHPLVQQELRRQRDDIRQLSRTDLDDPHAIPALRQAWRAREQNRVE